MAGKRNDITDSEVYFMYEVDGMTYQEIADYYAANISTIYYRLHPEKQRERAKKYCIEHIEEHRERSRKYYNEHTEQTLERVRKYQREHREQMNEYRRKRYREHVEEEREYMKEWWQTPNGKALARMHNASRRELGFIPLNEYFLDSVAHHIDEDYIIYIPKELHHSIWHNLKTGQGMEDINAISFHYVSEETFDKLIAGEI